MPEDELSELVARARDSDEEAARELVKRLYPAVIKIARNHLPRRESEEDLCQEIFLKIFARLHQYRADVPFVHWVSRISVNTCIDHLRKQRHRPEYRWSDFSEDQQAILENLKENSTIPAEHSPEESRELLNKLLLVLKVRLRLQTALHLLKTAVWELSKWRFRPGVASPGFTWPIAPCTGSFRARKYKNLNQGV